MKSFKDHIKGQDARIKQVDALYQQLMQEKPAVALINYSVGGVLMLAKIEETPEISRRYSSEGIKYLPVGAQLQAVHRERTTFHDILARSGVFFSNKFTVDDYLDRESRDLQRLVKMPTMLVKDILRDGFNATLSRCGIVVT